MTRIIIIVNYWDSNNSVQQRFTRYLWYLIFSLILFTGELSGKENKVGRVYLWSVGGAGLYEEWVGASFSFCLCMYESRIDEMERAWVHWGIESLNRERWNYSVNAKERCIMIQHRGRYWIRLKCFTWVIDWWNLGIDSLSTAPHSPLSFP